MRQLAAFTKKEFMEQWRTGRAVLLGIVFLLFGIMNPALAKLTPWMLELMADSLAGQGLAVTEIKVTAMTSWEQFYKNAPMGLLIFIILTAGIMTNEFQRGTLINMLTKGMSRVKVYLAKGAALLGLWTVCHFGSFGITYVYTAYYWDNSVAKHIWLGAFLIYEAGVLLICFLLMFSAFFSTTTAVLGAVGGVAVFCYLLSIFPKAAKYLPVYLLSSGNLLSGVAEPSDFTPAAVIALAVSAAAFAAGMLAFNKKAV